jgi:NAD(P)-dependent dehydrogenase (short-subunit alcohol dehydrogenase family)
VECTLGAVMQDAPVALITGAGSGIGRATAAGLARLGYRMALAARTRAALEETARLCAPAECAVFVADVSKPEEALHLVDEAAARFGRIDALVNNAGAAPLLEIEAHTPGVLEEIYAVNALAPANLIARAWPVFKRQRSGCIVNMSTMGTVDPFPGFFGYAAAKAAVNLMARSCANEGKEWGITAYAVAPGAVETPMLRGNFSEAAVPRGRTLRPEDVAAVVIECILGRRAAENGGTIVVPSP